MKGFVLPGERVTFLASPKAGSTTLKSLPAGAGGPRVLVLREPRDRLDAWLRHVRRLARIRAEHWAVPLHRGGFRIEREIDRMESLNNHHWWPQTALHATTGAEYAVRLEDIDLWWAPLTGQDAEAPRLNADPGGNESLAGPHLNRLRRFWLDDFDLWSAIPAGGALRLADRSRLPGFDLRSVDPEPELPWPAA